MKSSVTFESYLKELWRAWRRIVAITFAVAVVTAIVSLIIPKTYEATVQLWVLPPRYKPELASKTPEVQTCQFLLTSPKVMAGLGKRLVEGRRVLNELTAGERLDEKWLEGLREATSYSIVLKTFCAPEVALFLADLDDTGLTGLEAYRLKDLEAMTLEDLAESLNAVISEEKKTAIETIFSPIILLRARGRTGPQAAMLANAWADVFLEVYGGLIRTGLVGSYHFIASEADRFETERAAQQEKIRQLRLEFDLDFLAARVEGATQDYQALLTELGQQRLALDSETSRVASLDRLLSALEANGEWIGSTTASLSAGQPGLGARERALRVEVLASARRLRAARDELDAFSDQNDLETLTQTCGRARFDLLDFQSRVKREALTVERTAESLKAVLDRLAVTSPTLALERRFTTGTRWIEIPNPARQELEYKRVELETELAGARAASARLGPLASDLATSLAATSARLGRLETEHARLRKNLEFAQEEHDGYREAYIRLKRDRHGAAQTIEPLRARVAGLEAAVHQVQLLIDESQTSLTAGQTRLGLLTVKDETLARYLTLTLEKLQEARLAVAQQSVDVKVASEAIAPSRKIWPQRTLMVLVAAFLGFFFSVTAVSTRHYLATAGVWTEK